jgi:hypothetical protein
MARPLAGMVRVLVTPLPAKLKKHPEHSQSLERCRKFEKDVDVEGSESITSFKSI